MYKSNINRGMNWLDTNVANWKCLIGLSTFQIGDCKNCILGQIWGNAYGAWKEILELDNSIDKDSYSEWVKVHGFECNGDSGWDTLQAEWMEALTWGQNDINGEDGDFHKVADELARKDEEEYEKTLSYEDEEEEELSDCCGYPFDSDYRICPDCKEHC